MRLSSLFASFPLPMWGSGLLELRIDVQLPPSEVEKELDAIHRRLHRPGDALHDLPTLDIDFQGLRFRYRVADGEHYIYVEDVKRDCLAGYTIFNRLIELNRRQDKYLRATHSKYGSPYQRRGIATAIYRWWLDSGHSLISGARQSSGAHALWRSLGKHYALVYVDLREKKLRCLGPKVSSRVREDLHTRMLLVGCGQDLQVLAEQTGMTMHAV
ncbi:N-acetyltransferase [Herminiimonas sp. KBW02]|uniref:N-acetyltransferase n=1 Tax=Herminiimonas sp. KBW02 TaxID=2153363 RepID=UPI000F5B34A2|nr:N-acetyltransferase [Herminiimonas sp. KBW02]RQO35887.1 N-acetyltransferase [Herminiimonas sp. KBW02]